MVLSLVSTRAEPRLHNLSMFSSPWGDRTGRCAGQTRSGELHTHVARSWWCPVLSLATGGAGELHLLEEHGLLWAQERFGLPWYCSGKECPWNKGDTGSIPGSVWSFGEGNGNPLQYSCLETSVDRGAWLATVHGVTRSRTWLNQLSMHVGRESYTSCWLELLLSGDKQWTNFIFLTHPRYHTMTSDKILYFLYIVLMNSGRNYEKKQHPWKYVHRDLSLTGNGNQAPAEALGLGCCLFGGLSPLLFLDISSAFRDWKGTGNSAIIPPSLQNLQVIFSALLKFSTSFLKKWQKNMCSCLKTHTHTLVFKHIHTHNSLCQQFF